MKDKNKEETIEETTEEITERLQAKEQDIVDQVKKEYNYCHKSLNPKIEEWLFRLKVYNNQRRQKDKVGDPLLFTIFQTIFASLYDDGLNIEWLPREAGDVDKAESLNALSEFDNDEMKKDRVDYEWIWDTLFFGRGIMCLMEFDIEKKIPIPETWSPLVTLRDPEAVSVNGNARGKGGARFIGRETNQLKWELKDHPAYFNLEKIGEKARANHDSLHEKSQSARREAMGRSESHKQEDIGENTYIRTIQWFTFIDGERYFLELADNMSVLIRMQKLEDQDRFPLIDRPLFPVANDWDGVSVPDLVEDKQRARAVLLNAGLDIAKAASNPMYLFDTNAIKRRDQLNYEYNKFVPVDGNPATAVQPMQKDRISHDSQYIFQVLDEATQRALATPELQQGATPRRARTLGELELMSAKVDTRYSLAAKIFGWSEKDFWLQWYRLYKQHFDDKISEKVMRIKGAFGPEFKKIKKSDIIMTEHPDLIVQSEAIANAEKALNKQTIQEYIQAGSQMPGFNIRYALKELGRLSDFTKGKIDQLMPPVYDEIVAEEENEMLNKGKKPRVMLTDDHMQHTALHAKAKENKQRENHIKSHKVAIKIIHDNPEILDPGLIGEGAPRPMDFPEGGQQGRPAAPEGGQERPPHGDGTGRSPFNAPQAYEGGMPMGGQ